MRIALDAVGGDAGVEILVDGAVSAFRETMSSLRPIVPVLYGPQGKIQSVIKSKDIDPDDFEIIDAPDLISMEDRPQEAIFQKKRSSIIRAVKDLTAGTIDAFVSMGNTGVVVGACRAFLGRIRWISKPALGIPLPRKKGVGFLLDIGATVTPKPNHLVQFAAMGAAFLEKVHNISNPRIGLLNIGVEGSKGDDLALDTYKQMSRSQLRFIGNVEGCDILGEKADVIITSGFTGNILVKFMESFPDFILDRVKKKNHSPEMLNVLQDLDYSGYGGATLLGVNGTVVIGHGRSGHEAVTRAMLLARDMAENDLTDTLRERVFKTRRALWLSNPFSRGEGSEDES